VRAVILSIGSELVTGLWLDTHAQELARALVALGVEVLRHETVDDEASATADALRRACRDAELLLATGGLGPTLDDCTREALAEVLGTPLAEDPTALAHLEAWAEARGKTISTSNRRQALVPRGAATIPNPIGTALGLAARLGRTHLFFLPGVPGEMRRMLAEHVLPAVARLAPGRVTRVHTVRTFGLPESVVGERLGDLMAPGRRPHVGTGVRGGMVDVHVYASGTAAEAAAAIEADAAAVRERLGPAVFAEGDGRMEDAVADLLARRRRTLALAESCTGGLIAAKLVNVPGMSRYFLEGVVAYANEAKVRTLGVPAALLEAHGAVSEPVARAMAEGARARAGADLALGVTGIAGPDGGSAEKPVGTVWIALADDRGTRAEREVFTGDRALVRERAANAALNMLRLRLLEDEGRSRKGAD